MSKILARQLTRISVFHRFPILAIVLFLAALASISLPVIFGFASTPPSREHSQPQNAATIGSEFKYEPISIKVVRTDATPDYRGFVADLEPDGISVRMVTLLGILQSAYAEIDPSSSGFGLRDNQIVGTPNWATTYLFSIQGKIDPSVAIELGKLSPTQQILARAHMLQAMLADRFKLAVHTENREGPVYFLTVAKGGPKFKEAKPGEIYPKGPFQQMPWQAGWVVLAPPNPGSEKRIGLGADMTSLAKNLSMRLQSTVVDKTGLTGKYDFQLQWSGIDATPAESESSWPPLLTAIQQQMGLKLETGKGPTKVLVIDHVEKPSGN
jgi:uncharacterized protein (TIGR03435 family)